MKEQGIKSVVITGGSSGLGFAMAKYLAAKGYHPIIIARQRGKIDRAIDIIREMGYEATGFQGDITHYDDLKHICQEIKTQFGKIDFLILNAGVAQVKLLTDYEDIKEMKQDVEINLWGTILSAYTFIPILINGAKVLIVSSASGLIGMAGFSTYGAAKAGLINFGESLRRELLHKNISIYMACPGEIDTPLLEGEKKSSPDWIKKANPAGSFTLSPEVAAARILRKCSGKRFLITSDFEIYFLVLLKKILPKRILDFIIDRMVPMPEIGYKDFKMDN